MSATPSDAEEETLKERGTTPETRPTGARETAADAAMTSTAAPAHPPPPVFQADPAVVAEILSTGTQRGWHWRSSLDTLLTALLCLLHSCLCHLAGCLRALLHLPDPRIYAGVRPRATLLASHAHADADAADVAQVVLVTGASSGVGRDVAWTLAQRGYHVLAGVRRAEDGEHLRLAFAAWQRDRFPPSSASPTARLHRGLLAAVPLDLTQMAHIRLTVRRLRHLLVAGAAGRPCRIAALVHAAGVSGLAPLETATDDLWQTAFRTNLFGPMILTRALLPLLRGHRARVLHVGSVAAWAHGRPLFGPYAASKAALAAAVEVWRVETVDMGLSFSLIDPGTSLVSVFLYLISASHSHRQGLIQTRMLTDTVRAVRALDIARNLFPGNLPLDPQAIRTYQGQVEDYVRFAARVSDIPDTSVATRPPPPLPLRAVQALVKLGVGPSLPHVVTTCVLHALEARHPMQTYYAGVDAKLLALCYRVFGRSITLQMVHLVQQLVTL